MNVLQACGAARAHGPQAGPARPPAGSHACGAAGPRRLRTAGAPGIFLTLRCYLIQAWCTRCLRQRQGPTSPRHTSGMSAEECERAGPCHGHHAMRAGCLGAAGACGGQGAACRSAACSSKPLPEGAAARQGQGAGAQAWPQAKRQGASIAQYIAQGAGEIREGGLWGYLDTGARCQLMLGNGCKPAHGAHVC